MYIVSDFFEKKFLVINNLKKKKCYSIFWHANTNFSKIIILRKLYANYYHFFKNFYSKYKLRYSLVN